MVDVLAVNNFGDTRSGGLAGPMGLLIIVLMSIATVLLIRNMNKRLRRLPDSFDDPRTAQRDDDVADRDADRPDADGRPDPAGVDSDRLSSPQASAEAQVSDVDSGKGRTTGNGDSGPA
jgi:hypothetical protein